MQPLKIVLFFVLVNSCLAQHLLLGGGGVDKTSEAYWRRFVQLCGGRNRCKIGLITAGSQNAEETASLLKEWLKETYAADATWIPVTDAREDSANDPNTADLLGQQYAIYIEDGDPAKILRLLRNADGSDTLVWAAVRSMFNQGGMVGGNGAGATVLSGGPVALTANSYEALIHGSRATNANRRGMRKFHGSQYIAEGLGLLKSWIVDHSFNENGYHGRMIRLLLDTKETSTGRGIGLDKQVGLGIYRVGHDNEFAEVLGKHGGVTLVDVRDAAFQAQPYLDITGVNMTYLTEEDKALLQTGEVMPAPWKVEVSGQEWYLEAQGTDDIFASPANPQRHVGEFKRVASRLFNSKFGSRMTSLTWESSPQLVVEMDRRTAEAFHGDSPTTGQHVLSFSALKVSLSQQRH